MSQLPAITPRMRRVLILKANGYSNPAVGEKLGISTRTITKTLERIYRRYGVTCLAHAVAVGLAVGDIGVHEIVLPEKEQEAA